MSEFKYKSITTKGMELLAQAINGEKLEFTRIELGSGAFEGDIGSAESLVEVRQNIPITKITRKGSQVTLSTVLKIEDINASYNWTEIGVYARGEDGVEVLYMYGHTTNSSYISMDSLNEKLINVTVLVANTTQVTAVIDDSLVYLTAEALKEHEVDNTTHKDIRDSVEEVKQQLDQLDISWEGITGKPEQFKPTQHRHNASEIDDFPSSLPANGGNADTVGGIKPNTIYHTSNKPTKADVGLNNVQNVGLNWSWGTENPTHIWGSQGDSTQSFVYNGSQLKSFVGLSNVPNYTATSSVSDSSTTKFATASAVKQAYDKAQQAFQSASDGKNQIATAITGKGVSASGNDSFGTLTNKINQIQSVTRTQKENMLKELLLASYADVDSKYNGIAGLGIPMHKYNYSSSGYNKVFSGGSTNFVIIKSGGYMNTTGGTQHEYVGSVEASYGSFTLYRLHSNTTARYEISPGSASTLYWFEVSRTFVDNILNLGS